MTCAFFISAYHKPDLLLELVQSLEGRPVSIHIDKKKDIAPFLAQDLLENSPNVFLLKRHRCQWAHYGLVSAMLEGLRWFMGTPCSHLFLLTGQCYPLYRMDLLEEAMQGLIGRSLIDAEAFPRRDWIPHGERGGYTRIESHHVHKFNREWRWARWRQGTPLKMHSWGGSGYMCLARPHAEYIIDILRKHPGIERFYRTVWIPDEIMFHTLLGESSMRQDLIRVSSHYTDWSAGGSHPAILDATKLDAAVASGIPFARKFGEVAMMRRAERLRRIRPDDAGTLLARILAAPAVTKVMAGFLSFNYDSCTSCLFA